MKKLVIASMLASASYCANAMTAATYNISNYFAGNSELGFKLSYNSQQIVELKLGSGDNVNGRFLNKGEGVITIQTSYKHEGYHCTMTIYRPSKVEISGENFYFSNVSLIDVGGRCREQIQYTSPKGKSLVL